MRWTHLLASFLFAEFAEAERSVTRDDLVMLQGVGPIAYTAEANDTNAKVEVGEDSMGLVKLRPDDWLGDAIPTGQESMTNKQHDDAVPQVALSSLQSGQEVSKVAGGSEDSVGLVKPGSDHGLGDAVPTEQASMANEEQDNAAPQVALSALQSGQNVSKVEGASEAGKFSLLEVFAQKAAQNASLQHRVQSFVEQTMKINLKKRSEVFPLAVVVVPLLILAVCGFVLLFQRQPVPPNDRVSLNSQRHNLMPVPRLQQGDIERISRKMRQATGSSQSPLPPRGNTMGLGTPFQQGKTDPAGETEAAVEALSRQSQEQGLAGGFQLGSTGSRGCYFKGEQHLWKSGNRVFPGLRGSAAAGKGQTPERVAVR